MSAPTTQRRAKSRQHLPAAIWLRIIPFLQESSSLTKQDLLCSLGRECSLAMQRLLYSKGKYQPQSTRSRPCVYEVSLTNLDDALLVGSSGQLACPLHTLCASSSTAQLVTSLVISEPQTPETDFIYALNQAALAELLVRLDLHSFSWKSCLSSPAMGLGNWLAASSLTHFSCTLPASQIIPAEQASPTSEETTFYQPKRVQLTRWSGALLSCLPPSITTLVLGSLDHTGIKCLTSTLENLPSLQHLTLSDSQFVDDAILQELANVPSFTTLELNNLRSSKLTDVGIHAMLEGCESLKSLKLVDVESRLSKNCWEVEPCPAFESIVVSFTERNQVYRYDRCSYSGRIV